MKTNVRNLPVLLSLIAGLALTQNSRVAAQTFTTLHSFTGFDPGSFANADGANLAGGLVFSSGALYGTTQNGGKGRAGTVFKLNTDGTGFTNLHSFAESNTNSVGVHTNSDGISPTAGLLISGDTLYGTTTSGGNGANGTVFKLKTDGTAFTILYSFTGNPGPNYTNSDGAFPSGRLILLGDALYGTTAQGGDSGSGTVFALNTENPGFTNLYSFTATTGPSLTNRDGTYPACGLLLSSNTLYGMTEFGGREGAGTVFRVNIDGSGFFNLHDFTPPGLVSYVYHFEGFVLSGDTLYGTKALDDSTGFGSIFKVKIDGSGFTNLHSFTSINEGALPYGGLILTNNMLYGTAQYGGASANGTVFALNIDGTGFTNLYDFTTSSGSYPDFTNLDGVYPEAGLVLADNTLYGTTFYGGSSANGTVFGLSFAPLLTITSLGANLVLTWPTNYAGFDYTGFTLQSTTNLVPPAAWTTVFPGPVDIAGLNTVINPISGTLQFYRLTKACWYAGASPGPHWVLDLDSCNWVFMSGPGGGD